MKSGRVSWLSRELGWKFSKVTLMNAQHVKPIYIDALKLTLWQQLPSIVFCALLLDGGEISRVCLIATLGYWLLALICLARSEQPSNRGDLLFLRWGYFPLFGLFLLLNYYFQRQLRH